MEKIILLGSGGHAKSVVDTIEKDGRYEIAGFLEVPEKQSFSYKGYQVIGVDADMQELYKQGVKYAFVTMGYMGTKSPRESIYQQLKETHFTIPTLIDPTACVAADAIIEAGTFVGKQAIVNAGAYIGKMCIINSGAIIEHECVIGDYSHIAVGAVICGNTKIGKAAFIGANATIIQGIRLGNQVVVGAGSVVIHELGDDTKAVGNPARII